MNSPIGELLPPTSIDAHARPLVHRPARVSRDVHSHRWPSRSLVLGNDGRRADSACAKFFKRKIASHFRSPLPARAASRPPILNPLEAGDEAIICVNGVFSERMAIIAERTAAKIIRVEAPYGKPWIPTMFAAPAKARKSKFVGVTHGESSTAVVTNLDNMRKVADELGALLVVDTVSTLAGMPSTSTKRKSTFASAARKKLSVPLREWRRSPSARAAEEVLRARKTPVQSWYFDLTTTMNYWGKERTYHHTAPISLVFALREAMRMVLEEGFGGALGTS